MAMENRKPIADLTTEELKQLDADVMANVDLVGSCLFVASLFDEDILPPQGKRDKLRSKLHQDALLLKPFEPKKELDAIVEFAQNFFSKPPAQHTRSHLDKLRESLGKVRKWMDESAEEVIPEGTTTYQQLNVILQAILTSKLVDNLIYSTPKNPGQSSGAIWRGGTLEEFILTGDPIVEHLSRNNKDTETRLTTKGRWILRKIITKLRDAHEASTVYGELTLKNVQITNDHHILLPRLHHGNQESIRQDRKAFKELIESMTGDLPKDVRHLCKMLGSANPGSMDVMYNHPCVWSPQETIKNIYIFRMIVNQNSEDDNIRTSFVDMANTISVEEARHWTSKLGQGYTQSYAKWQGHLKSKSSHIISKTVPLISNALAVLFFMRNCFIHLNENLKQSDKKTPLQIERDLFVMFPEFLSEFAVKMHVQIKFKEYGRI